MIFSNHLPAESYQLPSDRMATLTEEANRLLLEATAIWYRCGAEASSEMFEVCNQMQKAIQTLKIAQKKRDALERKNAELHLLLKKNIAAG